MESAILETLIPKEEWEPFQQGSEEEYLQPLMDLGYLAVDQVKNATAVQQAIRLFRKEYLLMGWLIESMNFKKNYRNNK